MKTEKQRLSSDLTVNNFLSKVGAMVVLNSHQYFDFLKDVLSADLSKTFNIGDNYQ